MAALRKLGKNLMFSSHFSRPNSTILSSSSLLPALFISSRGIASKLFVGVKLNPSYILVPELKLEFKSHVSNSALGSSSQESKLTEFSVASPAESWLLVIRGLSFYTTEQGLSEAFSQYGQVVEAKIVMDRVSDRSKGFGFVTYASEDEAEKAIAEMNGKPLNGRVVFVDYAKPRSASGSGMPIARGPPAPAPAPAPEN
ncbi:Small RNA-binding protein 11, chloroplastic [Sesamum angolense]|uniref:Small RNA-binding protein 11, chloroplastic n=1 Tax=Sesamum angolense TaxID=2727404 RepID=A0AAE1WNI7_9LAMI|nr:Small RNA-binding protein 11, chloroplastic [Sesamum angolense]